MFFLYFVYRGRDLWYLDLQLPMQSEPVTTEVVNSNPAHAKSPKSVCFGRSSDQKVTSCRHDI
jgi:hypothetical protein